MTLEELNRIIQGDLIYVPELDKLEISGNPLNYISADLYSIMLDDSGRLLTEGGCILKTKILSAQFLTGFSGTLKLNLQKFLSACFSLTNRHPHEFETEFSFDCYAQHLSLGIKDEMVEPIVVCPFARCVKKVSSVDSLRVPHNYIIPFHILISGAWEIGSARFVSATGKVIQDADFSKFETQNEYVFLASRGICCPNINEPYILEYLDTNGVVSHSPLLIPTKGEFEQFLFEKEGGGFENIPMSGELRYNPQFEFENGTFEDGQHQATSEMSNIYIQNSGYFDKQTAMAVANLLKSPNIYHLKDGKWKRILLEESSISLSSMDSLHSFTFNFIYSDQS